MNNLDEFLIIPLQYDHCEQVYVVAKESLPEHWSLEGIRDVLKYDNNIYYVAVDHVCDRVIGFGGIMIVADEAELLNIAVAKDYRQHGIADAILKELVSDAKNSGAYRMLLEVRQHNDVAYNFYINNSFVVIGQRKNYYDNPPDDAIIMEKVFEQE